MIVCFVLCASVRYVRSHVRNDRFCSSDTDGSMCQTVIVHANYPIIRYSSVITTGIEMQRRRELRDVPKCRFAINKLLQDHFRASKALFLCSSMYLNASHLLLAKWFSSHNAFWISEFVYFAFASTFKYSLSRLTGNSRRNITKTSL